MVILILFGYNLPNELSSHAQVVFVFMHQLDSLNSSIHLKIMSKSQFRFNLKQVVFVFMHQLTQIFPALTATRDPIHTVLDAVHGVKPLALIPPPRSIADAMTPCTSERDPQKAVLDFMDGILKLYVTLTIPISQSSLSHSLSRRFCRRCYKLKIAKDIFSRGVCGSRPEGSFRVIYFQP